MQFFDNSSKAVEVKIGRLPGDRKYPWVEVPIGKSFAVSREEIKFGTLRSLASKTGKKLGRKFRVIDHGSGAYEVAHIPQTTSEAVASSTDVVQAINKLDITTCFPLNKTEEDVAGD